ncbi:CrcB family protein [Rothia sp. ZJ1223]|uniref:fluoride efflux transporter FluC n=1 Tax=Rothia sp. ZJ1223 TaxID=2811098 RepID=UPI00195A59AE|nr:CrcB family protein [Rothia sp. ZJ1223]MBM7051768.1 CrcB family protein [Rothia sp. ZJ1223]
MTLMLTGAIFIAGGVGAWCRYTLDKLMKSALPRKTYLSIPLINAAGSLMLGALVGALPLFAPELTSFSTFPAIAGIGFLGAFTTFSTAMVEAVTAARNARPALACWLLCGQLMVCIIAAWCGFLAPFLITLMRR